MHLYYAHMHTYIEQQFVAEIEDYVAGWEREGEVPDQLWPVVTGPDPKRYGAIFTWPTLYLVYNKDIFEEVGLDPERPPKTWDELFEYGLKLSNPDMIVETAIDPRGGFGRMGMFMQRSGSWIFPNFVWQAGGDIVKHREDGKWQAVFDSPKAAEALKFYHKLRWTRWIRCDCGDEIVVDPELLERAGNEDENTPAAGQVRLVCPTCGEEIRMFWTITLPLSLPVLAVIGLYSFGQAYGSFLWAFTTCQDKKMWTLMVFLHQFEQTARSSPYVVMAALVLAAIPTVVVFLSAQRVLMKGIVVPTMK